MDSACSRLSGVRWPAARRGGRSAEEQAVALVSTTRDRRRPAARPASLPAPARVRRGGLGRPGDARRLRAGPGPATRRLRPSRTWPSRRRDRPARRVRTPTAEVTRGCRRRCRTTVAAGTPHGAGRRPRGTRGASWRMTLTSRHAERHGRSDLWITAARTRRRVTPSNSASPRDNGEQACAAAAKQTRSASPGKPLTEPLETTEHPSPNGAERPGKSGDRSTPTTLHPH
jgi:hypothetical protein